MKVVITSARMLNNRRFWCLTYSSSAWGLILIFLKVGTSSYNFNIFCFHPFIPVHCFFPKLFFSSFTRWDGLECNYWFSYLSAPLSSPWRFFCGLFSFGIEEWSSFCSPKRSSAFNFIYIYENTRCNLPLATLQTLHYLKYRSVSNISFKNKDKFKRAVNVHLNSKSRKKIPLKIFTPVRCVKLYLFWGCYSEYLQKRSMVFIFDWRFY